MKRGDVLNFGEYPVTMALLVVLALHIAAGLFGPGPLGLLAGAAATPPAPPPLSPFDRYLFVAIPALLAASAVAHGVEAVRRRRKSGTRRRD